MRFIYCILNTWYSLINGKNIYGLFLHHVHFWLFWDDECPTYVIMMFEKNCFRIVSGRRHFAVLWLCHEINIWKSDDGVSMYRDVLYHIFEGYSLFINEYDFEECACTNNLAIHIYLWRISRYLNLLHCYFCQWKWYRKTTIISRFWWQTNIQENKSTFEHSIS